MRLLASSPVGAVSPLLLTLWIVSTSTCGGEPTGPGERGDAARLAVSTVEVTPAADTLTALAQTVGLRAVARDAQGNEVGGVAFTWSTSDASVARVDSSGVVTAEANGAARITATTAGVEGAAAIAVLQRVETVTLSPRSATLATVGAVEEFTASAVDANGNPVDGARFLWTSEDHTVATVDSAGRATAKGNGTSTITASAHGVPGNAELAVNQDISALAFHTPPTDVTAGRAIDPAVQVEVLDGDGNLVEDARVAVTVAVEANPGGGTLGGSRTVHATAGVATFAHLWIDAAGSGYTLSASAEGAASASSPAFAVDAAAPAQLAFRVQPSTVKVGEVLEPAVEVEIQDEFGNLTTANEPVTVSVGDNPPGAELTGTTTVDAVDGVAAFSDLALDDPAAGLELRASSGSLASGWSDHFAAILSAYVVNRRSGSLSVLELSTRTVTGTIPMSSSPFHIAVRPDGARAYVTDATADSVVVLDLANRRVVERISVGTDPHGVAVTRDGARGYVVNSGSRDVSVIDLSTDAVLSTVQVGSVPIGVAISPDGERAYVTNKGTTANLRDTVSVISTATNSVVDEIVTGTRPADIAIDPGGSFAYVTRQPSGPDSIAVIDLVLGRVVDHLESGQFPTGVAFTPDGRRAYVTHLGSDNVGVIASAGHEFVDWIAAGAAPTWLAVSPGGGLVVVTIQGDDEVAVIATATDRIVGRIPVGDGPVGIAIEPSG